MPSFEGVSASKQTWLVEVIDASAYNYRVPNLTKSSIAYFADISAFWVGALLIVVFRSLIVRSILFFCFKMSSLLVVKEYIF